MTDFGLGAGFESFQQDMEAMMGGFTEMRERIKEITGRGEAADGRIVAEYSAEGGLTKLELDPRALRLPSADLAEQIRTAVNAASEDFQRQVRELTSAQFPMSENPEEEGLDPAQALASLDKIANGFASQMRELAHELGVQQQRMQEVMQQYRRSGPPR
ncbi:YbaB/EbfC family nucleoid-associated protein [Thermomonospora catenispora]|uniref:YbaB/EbfC family nucleoid-associated protein n=1 Tax=Thermomonospora catenispora TaxID=2493090 RepID=UPI001124A325|nr:YbaB/EbfC family nucleoid-associated protein [Thermomonospora catenispora]TNY35853.1 YbaB/EbfC family DNA-binding protein [Thermomonospora catenispora]